MTPAMYRRNGWFPTVFDEFFNSDLMNSASNTAPSVNVKETEKAYTDEKAAPGRKKEYCRVHIDEDHNLCVAIENKYEHKEEDKHSHYLRREFSYTNFEQRYTLPEDVDEENINAKVEDGILTIELPKLKKVVGKTTKQIEIKYCGEWREVLKCQSFRLLQLYTPELSNFQLSNLKASKTAPARMPFFYVLSSLNSSSLRESKLTQASQQSFSALR